jgi:hypothetical protein
MTFPLRLRVLPNAEETISTRVRPSGMRRSDDRARVRPGLMLQRQQIYACNAYEMSKFSRGAWALQTKLSGEDLRTLSAWLCMSLVSVPFRRNSTSQTIFLRISSVSAASSTRPGAYRLSCQFERHLTGHVSGLSRCGETLRSEGSHEGICEPLGS